ncbi:MAG: amidohydrolase [Desulfobacteraceae bacterium]|nr:amidohydrolase [Desulfobacteraceae bacterium]
MKNIKIALVVQNCIAGNFDANLTKCLEFTEKAAQKGAEVVVFPEMNLTGYVTGKKILKIAKPVSHELKEQLLQKAQSLNLAILAGLAEKASNGSIFSSHLVVLPDGSVEKYRKIHTSPYEQKYFTPGDDIKIFATQKLNFGIQLCYDAHFPELTLSMALQKIDAVFIPHASPRGNSQEKFDSWVRHLRARAFDNSIFVFACNQTGNNLANLTFPGIALAIGPDGNLISTFLEDKEGIHMVHIKKNLLDKVRSHEMRYFLPNRRKDLFNL